MSILSGPMPDPMAARLISAMLTRSPIRSIAQLLVHMLVRSLTRLPIQPRSLIGCGARLLLAMSSVLISASGHAADYPDHTIRVIVAFGAGGIADTIARSVGQHLSVQLGQPVVIENRVGAGGTVGANVVAAARPDGYTLLAHTTAIAVNAIASPQAPDPTTQLLPIANTASAATIFVVHHSVSDPTLLGFLRTTRGGRFSYSTAGIGTTEHLTAEYVFRSVGGLDATHVPFQGGTGPVTAVIAQQIDLAATTLPTAGAYVRQGQLRVMAVAARGRQVALAGVPTLAEAGFPEFENSSWVGFFAPAHTPLVIAERLNRAIRESLRAPEVMQRLDALGFVPEAGSQAEFAAFIRGELSKWARVVQVTGFTVQ